MESTRTIPYKKTVACIAPECTWRDLCAEEVWQPAGVIHRHTGDMSPRSCEQATTSETLGRSLAVKSFRLSPRLYYYLERNTPLDMIQTFKDERTRKLMDGLRVVELANIEEQARTRLIRLDSATSLEDLRALRGNRLEALSGGRKG